MNKLPVMCHVKVNLKTVNSGRLLQSSVESAPAAEIIINIDVDHYNALGGWSRVRDPAKTDPWLPDKE